MKNVLPYKQNASGVQDFKLEDTLGHEKLAEALGEDLVFQLEALLVDRTSAKPQESAYAWTNQLFTSIFI